MYITQPLHRNVQQQPNAVATTCGDRVHTFVETRHLVACLAGGLRAMGVRSGDRVAILSLNSDRYLQTLLAIAWADAVMVPVNTRWSVKEIAYSLNEAGVQVLLVDDTFAGMVTALGEQSPQLRTIVHCGDGETPTGMVSFASLVAESQPIPDAHRGGDRLAGIFYTGGTTGFPKGVMLSHRNLLTSAMGSAAAGAWSTRGRVLHVAPMFHLADLMSTIGHLLMGSSHVIIPGFDPESTLAAIAGNQITDMLLVPTMIQMTVDHPRLAEFDLSSLRSLIYGASPISAALLTRARAAFPAAKFIQAYGMTELSPVATLLEDTDHDDPVKRRSAGRAAPHSLVRIVDPDGNEVPRGEFGEIVSSGDHVMLGYWNNPEESSSALRDGWMHTGDGGIMDDDGYVFVADRIKDMIISGGENVYSIEVENAVASHPAVLQCAVIGVPDQRWGERVHAVVSLKPGASLTLDHLQHHCREEIAGYKVPRSVEVVDTFPMSGAGKILKRELRRAGA
ncbi:long-chain-fatty-acid--CoA ligase [Gordonia rubripertincta]|uniref:Long-chain-fatty-acid--CoA ligase n=1 Tax=Gordonia rubripertincta TaxID=36822 RepID=A0AAW4FZB2_GORRU|nr:long-chain-fatty-acid--CoA ligase [Gordonia rubripertincta]MBM7276363.1 long-chain-fatty-acid--CoA ligase [Gordonia rubripertincta]